MHTVYVNSLSFVKQNSNIKLNCDYFTIKWCSSN